MKEISDPGLSLLKDIIHSSTPSQLNWIAGYIQGVLDSGAKPGPKNVSILYATESGNSKKVATELSALAKKLGSAVKLKNMESYSLNELYAEDILFAIISTQGEGEPPSGAKSFFESLEKSPQKLQNLKYSILALGDSSYPLFCKAGEDLDLFFFEKGGQRILPIQKCDADFKDEADIWFSNVLQFLKNEKGNTEFQARPKTEKTLKTKTPGRIKTHILLNDLGSLKKTYHVEIIPDGPLDYQPGDSISLIPENSPEWVSEILELIPFPQNEKIRWKSEDWVIKEVLTHKAQIVYLPKRVVSYYSEKTNFDIPEIRIDLLDLLKIYPPPNLEVFKNLVENLDPISPRLYSISSSPSAHGSDIHITVALDEFEYGGKKKYGHCSSFLSKKTVGETIDVLIHKNESFRLPSSDKDIIMIGPGTGIAPFRSFLFERDATLAEGKNWLFFGDQYAQTDFLYQTEIQTFIASGLINKISLAFSRDQKEKHYVWHEMERESVEFMQWLENGAYVYVCGSRDPMSLDVERTILRIISKEKGFEEGIAKAYLEQLKEEGRYVKDVY